jgi:hypothetical protein
MSGWKLSGRGYFGWQARPARAATRLRSTIVRGATHAGVRSTYPGIPYDRATWERVPSTREHRGGMGRKAGAKALVVASEHWDQGAAPGVACLSQLGQTWV